MSDSDDQGLLPCGTDPERLLVYAVEGTTPDAHSHEADCSYCGATISEYRHLWEPVRRWTTRDVAVPGHFVGTVMHRVRRIVQSPRHVATLSERGVTSVTSWVLGLIASAAALDTPDVVGITGTPTYANRAVADRYGADGVEITETGAADIAVALGLTAGGPQNLPALADLARRNIIHAITESTHIVTSEVDISIDDIDFG